MIRRLILFIAFGLLIYPSFGCGKKDTWSGGGAFGGDYNYQPSSFDQTGIPSSSSSENPALTETDNKLSGDWISDQTLSDGSKVMINFNPADGERKITVKTLSVVGTSTLASTGNYEIKDNTLTLKLAFKTVDYPFSLTTVSGKETLLVGEDSYSRLTSIEGPSLVGQIQVADSAYPSSTVTITSAASTSADSAPYATDKVFVKYKEKKKGLFSALSVGGETSAYVPVTIDYDDPKMDSGKTFQALSFVIEDEMARREERRKRFEEKVEKLRNDPAVESVTYNYLLFAQSEPNDPYFKEGKQNNLKAIQAPAAWDLLADPKANPNPKEVVVAVVDTGIRAEHSDLKDQVLKDVNGKVIGYDFVPDSMPDYGVNDFDMDDQAGPDDNPTDPGDGWKLSTEGDGNSWHGTHVAGIIAATTNNNLGISGVTNHVKILPLRVLGAVIGGGAAGTVDSIVKSIQYAAKLGDYKNVPDCSTQTQFKLFTEGGVEKEIQETLYFCKPGERPAADIINLSLGNPMTTEMAGPIIEAVNQATAKGILVVAASGNDGKTYSIPKKDNDKNKADTAFFPAAAENALAVGALNSGGTWWTKSNAGPYVDLVAPGDGIWSTVWNKNSGKEDYGQRSGTSQAAPHVTGVAAILRSQMPSLSVEGVKKQLIAHTIPFPGQGPTIHGKGLIQAYSLLVDALGIAPPKPKGNSGNSLTITAGKVDFGPYGTIGVVYLQNLGTDTITDVTFVKNFKVSVPSGVEKEWFSVTLDPEKIEGTKTASLVFKANRTGLPVGTYQGSLEVTSQSGGGKIGTINVTLEVKEAIDDQGLLDNLDDFMIEDQPPADKDGKDNDSDGVVDEPDEASVFVNYEDVGKFTLFLVKPGTNEVVSYAQTDIDSNYFFQIRSIPVGTYELIYAIDTNKDGIWCDDAKTEPCVLYPEKLTFGSDTHIDDLVLSYP